MRQGVIALEMPARLSDDDREFSLEVEFVGQDWPDYAAFMRYQCIGQANKYAWLSTHWGADNLGRMCGVVRADANDLAGFSDRRQNLHIRQMPIEVQLAGLRKPLPNCPRVESLAQCRAAAHLCNAEVANSTIRHCPVGPAAVDYIACDLHIGPPNARIAPHDKCVYGQLSW